MVILTVEERHLFEKWIVENVDETIVPADEGNGDGLIYNLVQRLRYGKAGERLYAYLPEQDAEIGAWRAALGLESRDAV